MLPNSSVAVLFSLFVVVAFSLSTRHLALLTQARRFLGDGAARLVQKPVVARGRKSHRPRGSRALRAANASFQCTKYRRRQQPPKKKRKRGKNKPEKYTDARSAEIKQGEGERKDDGAFGLQRNNTQAAITDLRRCPRLKFLVLLRTAPESHTIDHGRGKQNAQERRIKNDTVHFLVFLF